MIIPLNTLIVLNNSISNSNNLKIKTQIKQNIVFLAQKLYLINKLKNSARRSLILNFIELINLFGFGKIKIKQITPNKIIIENSSPVFYFLHFKLYHSKLKFESLFMEELIKNYFGLVYSKEINIILKHKNKKLYIILNLGNTINLNLKEEQIKKTNLREKDLKRNNLVKRILIEKQIKNKDNNLKLWKTNICLLPLEIFENLPTDLDFQDEIRTIGIVQGIAAAKLQSKLFGNRFIIDNIIQQSELAGIGIVLNRELDLEKKYLKIKIKENIGEYSLLRFYLTGLIIGTMEYVLKDNFDAKFLLNEIFVFKTNKKNKKNKIYDDLLILNNFF